MRVAVDTALAAGDLRTAAVGMYNLAESRGDVHGAASAIVAFDEAVAFSATIGLPTEPPRIYQLDRLVDVGRWEEALREAESLRAWAQAHGDRASLATIDWVVARVCLERGEAIGSRTELEASARVMGTFGYPYWWMGAEVALAHGDIETARALLAEALDTFGDDNVWSPVPFVRACIRAGASELARRALLQGVSPEYAASLPMARTMLAEVDGDLRVAHDGYERASDVSADRGELPEHAYALAGLGRCLLALGKTGDGIVRLRESREIWERLQATPRIAEIDAALAAAGAASGPDPELA
jgi:tetratricopeptide (TPR) repeat protein